jgi:hypothetical protein
VQNTVVTPAGNTVVTFKEPLDGLYDAASAVFTANLAFATQGATVSLDVLGSGNAAVPHQSFTLKRPPLTWTCDSFGNALDCSLEIRINSNSGPTTPPPAVINPLPVIPRPTGQLWTRVNTLFGTAPDAQVYTLTTTDQGIVSVRFGDGIQGARLPTGTNNVMATYRSGSGPKGNVAAGSLIVFRKRPLGLRAVSNPIAATLGIDPEPMMPSLNPVTGGTDSSLIPSTRDRLNIFTRALDRIVTLADYHDFTLAQPEVVKVDVQLLTPANSRQIVYLTVAMVGGNPVETVPGEVNALTRAIKSARADQRAVQIGGFVLLYFRVQATLHVGTGLDPDAIRRAVFQGLRQAFSPANRGFGQPVTTSEIETTIMRAVPRGSRVEINDLYLSGDLPSLEPLLIARPARLATDQATILLAELLTLDPSSDEEDALKVTLA